MKYLEKYKTGKKVPVVYNCNVNNIKTDITLYGDEYQLSIYDIIELIIDLKKKQKFYKSIIGKLFFNGSFNIIDVEYALKVLKNNLDNSLNFVIA